MMVFIKQPEICFRKQLLAEYQRHLNLFSDDTTKYIKTWFYISERCDLPPVWLKQHDAQSLILLLKSLCKKTPKFLYFLFIYYLIILHIFIILSHHTHSVNLSFVCLSLIRPSNTFLPLSHYRIFTSFCFDFYLLSDLLVTRVTHVSLDMEAFHYNTNNSTQTISLKKMTSLISASLY